MIEAYEEKYLDVFCVGIISNIWAKRERVKTYDNGSTSTLYMASNYLMNITSHDDADEETKVYTQKYEVIESHLPDPSPEYDYDKDQNIQRANDFITELIEAKKESEDQAERFRSRVFYYSKYRYKNTRQFSKASGIPYNVCWEAVDKFKQLIKTNINDLRPDSGF